MSELVTSGVWTVRNRLEAEFVEAWTEFAAWAARMPGAGTLRLTCDVTDPHRFVSFAPWASAGATHAWKQLPDFPARMGEVLQHVDIFDPSELAVVATVGAATQGESR